MSSRSAVWSKRVAAWRSSGESAAAYCRARGLSYSKFVYWRRRSSVMAAVPVVVGTLPAAEVRTGSDVELVLPNGLRLHVRAVPMAELAALVRALC